MLFPSLAIVLAAAGIAQSAVVPLTPGTVNAGEPCLIQFTPDNTGTWKNATLLLRSGSNLAMTTVTTVLAGFDATTGGEIAWTCPQVNPNSAIYFYEFNLGGLSPQWTTRFAIASAAGKVTTPTNPTQPGSATVPAIPWGNGKLAKGAVVVKATISGGSAGTTASGVTVSSAAAGASSSASSLAASSGNSSSLSSTSSSTSAATAASAAATSSSTNTSGAGRGVLASGCVLALAGLGSLILV